MFFLLYHSGAEYTYIEFLDFVIIADWILNYISYLNLDLNRSLQIDPMTINYRRYGTCEERETLVCWKIMYTGLF